MSNTMRPDISIAIRDSGGQEHQVTLSGEKDSYLVGRLDRTVQSAVELALNDKHVSRRHCAIVWSDPLGGWALRDSKSANGTRLNEELVGETPAALYVGAEIKVGTTLLTVTGFGSASAAAVHSMSLSGEGDDGDGTTQFLIPDDDSTRMIDPATVIVAGGGRRVDPDATRLADATTPADGAGGGGAPADATVMEATMLAPPPPARPAAPPPARRPPAPVPASVAAPVSAPPVASASAPVPAKGVEGQPAGLTGLAAALVRRNLLENGKAQSLSKLARETGRTFFRVMSDDTQIRYHAEIYTYAGEDLGLELIQTEKQLMDRAVPTTYLPFTHATNVGAVMLSSATDDQVHYATVDPYDITLHDWVERCSGRTANRILVAPQVFQSALQRLKNRGDDPDSGTNVLVIEITPEEEKRISTQIDNVDVPQVVNYFLQRAFVQGASDIHIEPTEDFLLVRNRVDGILHEDTSLPVALHPEIASRIKIISGMDVAEKRRPQDGRIASVIRSNPIDVRVSSYPTIYGEKVVMRLLDKNALRPSPEHLGMLARDLRLLYDKLDAPFGLVMISGPTGSGKTTTLYSCLGSIDKKTKNVLTVEDPVEYRLKGVHQMQVNDKIGLTFASGLRTMLRQDPDVIMVGECRDVETAGMAIQASLTGHIVFSTIHTNDAVGVITRLLDMGIDPFLVANALTLAIAQRLVRRICKHCKTTITGEEVLSTLENDGVSAERLAALNIQIDPYLTYAVGAGCVHCRNTGYQGRQAVFEVFEMTNGARTAIMSPGFNADVLRREARAAGMTTLIAHGLQQIEEGITTHAEVIRVLGETY